MNADVQCLFESMQTILGGAKLASAINDILTNQTRIPRRVARILCQCAEQELYRGHASQQMVSGTDTKRKRDRILEVSWSRWGPWRRFEKLYYIHLGAMQKRGGHTRSRTVLNERIAFESLGMILDITMYRVWLGKKPSLPCEEVDHAFTIETKSGRKISICLNGTF